jgi:hypothetical protein
MVIFPHEIGLRDIPCKKKLWAQEDLKFQRGHIYFSRGP